MAATFYEPYLLFNPPSRLSNSIPIPINLGHRRSLSIASIPRHTHRLSPIPPLGLGMDRSLLPKAVSAGGGGGGDDGFGGRGNSGGGGGGGGHESGGDGWSPFKWYMTVLETHPLITKSITSGLLNLFGDLLCQFFIDQVPTWDVKRSFVFTFIGLALVGPTLHYWYLALSKLVTLSGTSGVLLRLFLDQFIFSPFFIAVSFSAVATLEGTPSLIWPKLQQDWFSSVKAGWQLWIPFQFINFKFVPQNLQVLAANVVALAWNVIISFMTHKEVVSK